GPPRLRGREVRGHHRRPLLEGPGGRRHLADHLPGRAPGHCAHGAGHPPSRRGARAGGGVAMAFFFDLFVNGLMIGSMYALVALGFVLIYKATSVVNFAQGELVMFGGYIAAALVSLYHLPLAVALPVLLGTMVGLGFVLERGVLRPMVGQAVISVVMVTIGLAQVFQGAAAMLWGAQTKNIPLPIPLEPYVIWEIYVSPINLLAALISGAFLVGLIIGGVETVAAGYVDPYVGGGTKDFVPYVLMILALMIRPYGFFGREIIERV